MFGIYLLLFLLVMGAVVGVVGWDTMQAIANEEIEAETAAAGMNEQRLGGIILLFGFVFAISSHVLNRVLIFHRMAHAVVTSLALTGTQDFSQVTRALDEAPKLGEGLADAFDLGDF
jgi:amino acid transporter